MLGHVRSIATLQVSLGWLLLSGLLVLKVAGAVAAVDSVTRNAGALQDEAQALWSGCRICHSTVEMQRGPMLEGLPSWYVLAQLEKFRKGVRGKDPDNKSEWLMGSAIQQFSQTNAWSNLAQWISRQPPTPGPRVIRGDREKGRQLYAACASCHGALGEGQAQLGGPPLNVQEDWYLREQMVKFKQGARGHHQADLGGIIMREAAQGLEKSDIDDLVAFLGHLRPKAQIQSENH